LRDLVLLDHPAGRVVLLGQFDGGVDQRAAALVVARHMGGHLFEPSAQLRPRVARICLREAIPA
jgi:hypothetical protein